MVNPFARASDYIGAAIGLHSAIWADPPRNVRRAVVLTFPVSLPLGLCLTIVCALLAVPWAVGAGIVTWARNQWRGGSDA